jgi:hypothetical protein
VGVVVGDTLALRGHVISFIRFLFSAK